MFWCHSCYTQTIRKGQSRDPLDLGLADDGGWRVDQESLKNLGRSGVESRCVNKYSSGSVSGPNFHLDGSITSSHAGVFWYLDGARQDTDDTGTLDSYVHIISPSQGKTWHIQCQ